MVALQCDEHVMEFFTSFMTSCVNWNLKHSLFGFEDFYRPLCCIRHMYEKLLFLRLDAEIRDEQAGYHLSIFNFLVGKRLSNGASDCIETEEQAFSGQEDCISWFKNRRNGLRRVFYNRLIRHYFKGKHPIHNNLLQGMFL